MIIIPINKLRNTVEFAKLCHENNEPIFITKNGYGDMVAMNYDYYKKFISIQENYIKKELKLDK